jgi:hypothetical protein
MEDHSKSDASSSFMNPLTRGARFSLMAGEGNDYPPTFLEIYSTGKWDGDTLVVDTRGSMEGHGWIKQANLLQKRST